jgi:hexosaminidase
MPPTARRVRLGSPSPRLAPGRAGWLPLLAMLLAMLGACARATPVAAPTPTLPPAVVVAVDPLAHAIIPAPAAATFAPGDGFEVDTGTVVVVDADASIDVEAVARQLTAMLAPAARPPRRLLAGETRPPRSIHLTAPAAGAAAGVASHPEGYELRVGRDGVTISASRAAGFFHGVQTLRQLLPVSIEHPAALRRALTLPAVHVADAPRYAWRGAMLDVSRHFLAPADVKRFVDAMALYKLNRLHLHLADDQGWRIEIRSWPNLARHGGSTGVGGGAGGYYTQAEFADLVSYAAERFVEIVPEIDMPGHTNAALASYASLNCDGAAPPLYTGTGVGFSALCVERDSTYKFVSDVVREISALTRTPYFHIGGDEVEKLTHAQYTRFIERVQDIVRSHGKQVIGWSEIAPAALLPSTVVQHWRPDSARVHAARGGKIILSPAKHVYLDMKYDSATVLGLRWAALIGVRDAYAWEPSTYLPGVPESAILGVEAPLWAETLETLADYEFMAFPRLAAVAELAWSPASVRGWEQFRLRLATHGPRLSAMGINFYRSPQVPWLR